MHFESVAALRAFALVDRETIADERDASVTTDCIRLHRLVRDVAAARRNTHTQAGIRGELMEAMAEAYPRNMYSDPRGWPSARRLDAIAAELLDNADVTQRGLSSANILNELASYREAALGAYADALPYYERALGIHEKVLSSGHPDTAVSLSNLGGLLVSQGDLASARSYYERALTIFEEVLGPEHPNTATSLNSLGHLLQAQGDLVGARPYYERALAICEKRLGRSHPNTQTVANNVAMALDELKLHKEASAIRQKFDLKH